ncbi:MAG: GAP family protein [Mycobacterium sp.]|nr:GAP family protein [Mycobacterium sp.]
MWITLLVMAIAVSLEPFRLGMTVVMLNRPRPVLQLAAFLAGGFLMGLSVGAVVLFVVHSWLPKSGHLTLPQVQIVIGLLALGAAAIVAATKPRTRTPPDWLNRLLDGRSLWVAGGAGLGIALPSVDYLAALALIAAAGATPATQFTALLMFNVVAFALVEIPLLAYLVAPERTGAAMTRLHGWIRTRPRRGVAGLLAVVGTVLVAVGLLGLKASGPA